MTNLGKRRYKITDSARKSLPYYQLLNDLVSFEMSFAPNHTNYSKSRNSLPYSFAYFDPYTNSIPATPKLLGSTPKVKSLVRDLTNQNSSDEGFEEYDRMSVQESSENNDECSEGSKELQIVVASKVEEYDRMSIQDGDFEAQEFILIDMEDDDDDFADDGTEFYQWFPSPNGDSMDDSMDLYPWFPVPKSSNLDKSAMSVPEVRKMMTPRRCKIPPSYLSPYVRRRGGSYSKPESSPDRVTLIRKRSFRALTKVVAKIGEMVFPSSFKHFVAKGRDEDVEAARRNLTDAELIFRELNDKLKFSVH